MGSRARLPWLLACTILWTMAAGACVPVEPVEPGAPDTSGPAEHVEPSADPAEADLTEAEHMAATDPSLQTADQIAVVLGNVTFSPPGPGPQQAGGTPEIAPQLLEDRTVLVFGPDGETLVAEVPVEMDATFRLELAPGTYVIGITLVGIERSESVPVELVLAAGDLVELEIAIDSGLR